MNFQCKKKINQNVADFESAFGCNLMMMDGVQEKFDCGLRNNWMIFMILFNFLKYQFFFNFKFFYSIFQ